MKPRIFVFADPDIYNDLPTLPDPVPVSFNFDIYNYTGAIAYMKAVGVPESGWTWTERQLGDIANGAHERLTARAIGSRTKPGSALNETIFVDIEAYSDAAYTILVASATVPITMHWIDSSAMTLFDLDNFDDGTVMGWACRNVYNATSVACNPQTDFYLSAGYSLRKDAERYMNWDTGYFTTELYKSFAIGDWSEAYAIMNLRHARTLGGTCTKGQEGAALYFMRLMGFKILQATTVLQEYGFQLYKCYEVFALSDWKRFVVPLGLNQTEEIKIRQYVSWKVAGVGTYYERTWLDDFMIVYTA